MPLSVLLPLVVVGITLIVVLVRLLAPTPPCRFATPDEAIAVWDRRHPDLPASAARLADDGAAALVETAGGGRAGLDSGRRSGNAAGAWVHGARGCRRAEACTS